MICHLTKDAGVSGSTFDFQRTLIGTGTANMSEEYQGTITRLLQNFKTGDTEARKHSLAEIWKTYFERLKFVASKVLTNKARRDGDEEDVVISVFGQILKNVDNGSAFAPEDSGSLGGLPLEIHSTGAVVRFQTCTLAACMWKPITPFPSIWASSVRYCLESFRLCISHG